MSDFMRTWLEGIELLDKNNYLGALEQFEFCENLASKPQEFSTTYSLMGKCYYLMEDYEEALKFLNKSLDSKFKLNDIAFDYKSRCCEKLGQHAEALIAISLFDFYTSKDYNEKSTIEEGTPAERTKRILDAYTKEKTNELVNSKRLKASSINCSEIFDTFDPIIPKGVEDTNDVAYILEHSEYEKLYDYFLNDDSEAGRVAFEKAYSSNEYFSYNLILSSIFYICGMVDKSLEALESPKTKLEKIFKAYVNPKNKEEDINLLEIDDNPSVKFWYAKLLRKTNSNIKYLDIMDSLKKTNYPFVYCELFDYFKEKRLSSEILEVEEEALKMHSNDSKLVFRIFTHYYNLGKIEKATSFAENYAQNDLRGLIMKGLISGTKKDYSQQLDYYNQALEKEEFFKIYLYLSDMNNKTENEYIEYIKKALNVSPTYNDVYNCLRNLLEIENKKEVEALISTADCLADE